jgi:HK97 family phage major capsid protein
MPFNNIISRTDASTTIPVEYSLELIEGMQSESSAVMGLARRLRDMTAYEKNLPVLSALATAYFIGKDTGLVPTTEVNWTNVQIYAEKLAVMVPTPRDVLNDSNIPIWDQIRPELTRALGKAVDHAILYGTNAPSTWPTAIITAAASHSHGVAIGTGFDLYEDILVSDGTTDGVFPQVERDGYAVTACLADLSMKGRLRGVRDANGNPIFASSQDGSYTLDNVRTIFPTNGAASSTYPLIAGDWRYLAYSIRQGMTFRVYDQGVIQDQSGTITHNLMQQDEVALMIIMQLGFAIANPPNPVNETEATRYPFSFLSA